MTIVGGLRARLIHDSLHAAIDDGLRFLGWYDAGRDHRSVQLLAGPADWKQPIEPNLVAIDVTAVDVDDIEVGSFLTQDTITVYVDIYAESDSFGNHIANDIRDILRGRLGTTTANGTFPVYDYRAATPPVVGHVIVGNVSAIRDIAITQDVWMRHRYRVRCELQDAYYTSEA